MRVEKVLLPTRSSLNQAGSSGSKCFAHPRGGHVGRNSPWGRGEEGRGVGKGTPRRVPFSGGGGGTRLSGGSPSEPRFGRTMVLKRRLCGLSLRVHWGFTHDNYTTTTRQLHDNSHDNPHDNSFFPKHCLQYGVLTFALKEYVLHRRPQSYQIKVTVIQPLPRW